MTEESVRPLKVQKASYAATTENDYGQSFAVYVDEIRTPAYRTSSEPLAREIMERITEDDIRCPYCDTAVAGYLAETLGVYWVCGNEDCVAFDDCWTIDEMENVQQSQWERAQERACADACGGYDGPSASYRKAMIDAGRGREIL